ncbi:MAG: carboxypeptidase M32, partial [Planctomycetota bacterium]
RPRLAINQVGRSRAFWTGCYPVLVEHFGDAVSGLSPDEVFAAANRVSPSLIRVEADEATYNLHIMIRFELERALLKGDLTAAELPTAWNEKYRDYLGVDVPSDAQGCLQDIHWSMGALGYFPTYTLGNLYSAQFFEAARAELGDLHAMFAEGEFAPLLDWLRKNIHAPGHTYDSADLCEKVTGRPLTADPLMRHLEEKLLPIYGL